MFLQTSLLEAMGSDSKAPRKRRKKATEKGREGGRGMKRGEKGKGKGKESLWLSCFWGPDFCDLGTWPPAPRTSPFRTRQHSDHARLTDPKVKLAAFVVPREDSGSEGSPPPRAWARVPRFPPLLLFSTSSSKTRNQYCGRRAGNGWRWVLGQLFQVFSKLS